MIRRWFVRLLWLAAGLALLLALAHTPVVQAWALEQGSAFIGRRTGLDIAAARLSYNLFTHRVSVEGLSVARRGETRTPFLRIDRASATLTTWIVTGLPPLSSLEADGVTVRVDLDGRGPESGPVSVPPFILDRARLTRVDVEILDRAGVGIVAIRGTSLDLRGGAPGRMSGAFTVDRGVSVEGPDLRIGIDRVEGRLSLADGAFAIEPSLVVVARERLAAGGSIRLSGPSARYEAFLRGRVRADTVSRWFPSWTPVAGSLDLSVNVTGALSDPHVSFDASSPGLQWPSFHLPRTTAAGHLSRAGVAFSRAAVAVGNGTIDGRGFVTFAGAAASSRVAFTFTRVRTDDLLRAFPGVGAAGPSVSLTGSAQLGWPGAAASFATLAGHLDAGVEAATGVPPVRAALALDTGTWQLQAQHAWPDEARSGIDATIRIDPADIRRSPIAGTAEVSAEDAGALIGRLRGIDGRVPDAPAWLQRAPATLAGTLAGTLAEPRLDAALAAPRVQLAGIGPVAVESSFSADAARLVVRRATVIDLHGNRAEASGSVDSVGRRTEGTATALIGNPAPFIGTLGDGWHVEGTVSATATWGGALDDPTLRVRAATRGAAVRAPGVVSDGLSADVTIDGPLAEPRATGSATMPHVRLGGKDIGPVTATLTLGRGHLSIDASAPSVAATARAQAEMGEPRAFSGTIALHGSDVRGLAPALSIGDRALAPGGLVSGRLDLAGSLGQRTVTVGGQLLIADGALVLDDQQVADRLSARLDIRNGRIELSSLTGTALQGPVDAAASVPLDWAAGLLPEGWALTSGAPAAPATAELRASPRVTALLRALGAKAIADDPEPLPLEIRLDAAAPEVAALRGRIAAGPLSLEAGEAMYAMDGPLRFELDDGTLRLLPATLTGPRTSVTLSGRVGLLGAHDLAADFSATGSLQVLSALAPGRFAGMFDGRLTAAGTLANPRVTGGVSIDAGSWVWPAKRLALTEWTGTTVWDAGAVTIRSLRGQVNGGSADLTGSVALTDAARAAGLSKVTLRVRDAFVEALPGVATQLDALLTLTPDRQRPRITGTITATSGSYREPLLAMAKTFAPSAPRAAARRAASPAAPSPLSSVALDIALAATAPLVVENSAGRLDLLPDLRIGGTLAAPEFSGALAALDDGRLTLAGRTYRLRGGRIVFAAGSPTPRIELVGETQIGSYAVTLRTDGPADELQFTYASDPPLGERDIRSLLVTGRVSDATSASGTNDDRFAIGAASSDLLGMAGQFIGLDSVQLGRGDFELGSSDVNPAMRLTVGKSINPRFRVVLSQNLDDNKFTWIVILDTPRSSQVRLSQRDNHEQVIEFRQEIEFGPGVPRLAPPKRQTTAPRERIDAVRFTGSPGFREDDLLDVLDQTAGRFFDMREWQRDLARLQQLYRERGFVTALVVPSRAAGGSPPAAAVELTYRIERGPRTVLRVTGIDLPARDIQALMRVWGRAVLPEFVRDDLTAHMRRYLAGLGYLRAGVRTDVTPSSEAIVTATITVEPGPHTRTRTLSFEGTQIVSEGELRAELAGAGVIEEAWTDPAPLASAITDLYAARGYLAATAVPQDVRFDNDRAELRVLITEGPVSTLARLTLTGVSEGRDNAVRLASGLREGQIWLPEDDRAAARRIERYYRSQGFLSATVMPSTGFDAAAGATLAVAVAEGPQSIVRGVEVSGIGSTHRGLVDGAIRIRPGSPADPADATDTQKRLYALGAFRRADVRFDPVTPEADRGATAPAASSQRPPGQVPVTAVVSLQEARRYVLRYGIQAANQHGSIVSDPEAAFGVSGDVSDRNFLNRGFTLGASGRIEWNLRSARGLFALPRLFDQRLQSTFYSTWRWERQDLGDGFTLTERQRELSFEQRWQLSRRVDLSWGYAYNRDTAVLDTAILDSEAIAEIPPLGGKLASLNATLVADTRDSVFDATRGFFQSTNVQWGVQNLGSDFSYLRILLRQFFYQRAGPLVLASGVRWGRLKSLSGTAPLTVIDLLFGAGGSQTVRGYGEDTLSAIYVFDAPIGGPEVLLLNQEVRFPIAGWFSGAVFVDAGNTFTEAQPVSLGALALGTGIGLRVKTPIAPLRFDLGWPINPRPGDRPWRLYFSIGQMF